ncbi:TetR/AcrR family transcriptional regulator [Phenylobacterium sp.]|uniref:TetR/AcrR family transcriptional regulator n=1 Tax=Phenylobacterium sp. TaxID=1871053 RepID=UPI003982EC93
MNRPADFKLSPSGATLRRRALDAAQTLLEEAGVEGLHLRVIADKAGSAVASLYYHFADKDALLTELAKQGWRDLGIKIARAMDRGAAPHQVDAASSAYLQFIQDHPQLYALMQSCPILTGDAHTRAAEQEAFVVFRSSLDGDDRVPAAQVESVALLLWVLGRGIAAATLASGAPDPGAAADLRAKVLSGFTFLLSSRFRG